VKEHTPPVGRLGAAKFLSISGIAGGAVEDRSRKREEGSDHQGLLSRLISNSAEIRNMLLRKRGYMLTFDRTIDRVV
jgi:hypothetical protein